jgi:hypothetical protein
VFAIPISARLRGRRALPIATGIALASLLVGPSLVAAAPAVSATVSGNTLNAAVTGGERVGAWRVRIVAPGGRKRIDFVLRTGDVAWNGIVRVSRLRDGRWTVISRRALGGSQRRLEQASGTAAGVRWDTSDFRLPSEGDGRFEIHVQLTRNGKYRMVGAVRVAVEAFSFGPWRKVGTSTFSR